MGRPKLPYDYCTMPHTEMTGNPHLQAAGVEGAAGGEDPVALRRGLVIPSAALARLHTSRALPELVNPSLIALCAGSFSCSRFVFSHLTG